MKFPALASRVGPLAGLALLALAAAGQGQERAKAGKGGRAPAEAEPEDEASAWTKQALEQLARTEELAFDALYALRPWLAPAGTRAARSAELGGFDGATYGRYIAALEAAQGAIIEIDLSVLPRDRELDALALRGWSFGELQALSVLKPLESDPAYFVNGIERSLGALAPADQRAIDTADLLTLVRRMELVPAALASARVKLAWVARAYATDALDAIADLEASLSERWGAFAEQPGVPSELGERLRAARDESLAALAAFETWIEELSARSAQQTARLSEARWARLVESATGELRGVSEIQLEALAAISAAAGAIGADVEPAPVDFAESAAFAARAAQALAEALDAARIARLAPCRFELELRPTPSSGRELMRWSRPSADVWQVALSIPDASWTAEALATRARELQPAALAVHAMRAGGAGSARLRYQSSASLSLSRARLPNDARAAAHGLYVVDRALALGLLPDPGGALAAEFARQCRSEATRLFVTTELHAQDATDLAAAERFALFTGCDAETARSEATAAARDPRRGLSYWIYRQALELERALALPGDEGLSEPEALRARFARTLAALEQHPIARIPDLAPLPAPPAPPGAR